MCPNFRNLSFLISEMSGSLHNQLGPLDSCFQSLIREWEWPYLRGHLSLYLPKYSIQGTQYINVTSRSFTWGRKYMKFPFFFFVLLNIGRCTNPKTLYFCVWCTIVRRLYNELVTGVLMFCRPCISVWRYQMLYNTIFWLLLMST